MALFKRVEAEIGYISGKHCARVFTSVAKLVLPLIFAFGNPPAGCLVGFSQFRSILIRLFGRSVNTWY